LLHTGVYNLWAKVRGKNTKLGGEGTELTTELKPDGVANVKTTALVILAFIDKFY